MDEIVFDIADGIGTIRLNRPERLNAFTLEMVGAWVSALELCRKSDDVKVVVLTGTGRGFCTGSDTTAMKDRVSGSAFRRKSDLWDGIHGIAHEVQTLDKPLLVAVNGLAVGAGLDMALMGDIRLAAESARFGTGYLKMGLVPGNGGAWLLPRLVGTAKALELLWSEELIGAGEAERIGLANRVVPDDDLMPQTYATARRLADGPTLAIRLIKRAVRQSFDMDFRTHLDMMSSHLGVVATTEDHAEAVAARLAKRAPLFRGR